jgi:tetratricopeptide (TPR) repeat protein
MHDPAAGADRDTAWEELEQCLARAREQADRSVLLTPEAVSAARRLAAAATDPAADPGAARTLAWYHWNRYLILPKGHDRADFELSIRYFGPLFSIQPGLVPQQIRGLMQRGARRGAKGMNLERIGDRVAECFEEFQRTGQLPALIEAAMLIRASVEATKPKDPNYAIRRSNLAAVLLEIFHALRWAEVLAEARDLSLSLLDAFSEGDPDRITVLFNLGSIQRGLYEGSDELQDLHEAERWLRMAIAAAPPDDPRLPVIYSVLGYCLRTSFERAGETGDRLLAEALEAGQRSVQIIPPDHPLKARVIANLSVTQWLSALRADDLLALRSAVETGRRAVSATFPGHIDYPPMMSNLGCFLLSLFQHTYEIDVLEEAVGVGRAAVKALPAGHPQRAWHQANLCLFLAMLSGLTGESADLYEAVAEGRAAVAATTRQDVFRGAMSNNLAAALYRFYEHTGEIDALVEALDRSIEAVRLLPADHPERASALSNAEVVTHSLYELFDRFGPAAVAEGMARPELLTETVTLAQAAVDSGKEALAVMARSRPDRARFLGNLGAAQHALFDRTGDLSLLDEALDHTRRAIDALPPGHAERGMYANNLGNFLRAHGDRAGSPAPLADAYAAYTEACENTAATARIRIAAYRNRASLDIQAARPGAALESLERAIELIQSLASRSLRFADREHVLGQLSGLAGECCTAALAAGRPEYAVELLEQTRGLLAADRVEGASSDLARLRVAHPRLADEVDQLRDRMDTLAAASLGPQSPIVFSGAEAVAAGVRRDTSGAIAEARRLADERRGAYARWTGLLERIRALDEFAGFLRAPRFADLAAAGAEGPVVFLCTGPEAGSALIVGGEQDSAVRVVRLPGLNEDETDEQVRRFVTAVTATRDDDPQIVSNAQAEILGVMEWLWDATCGPVLSSMGLLAPEDDARARPDADAGGTVARPVVPPRLWWCPVGLLAFLPIHAAGRSAVNPRSLGTRLSGLAGPPGTVLDSVVSSYTATLRGLVYARSRRPSAPEGSTLVVSVPGLEDYPALPGALAEAERVAGLLAATWLANPTRREVLGALAANRIAHFACHASANARDPGTSRLVLADHADIPLTVRDISALKLTADLAFLSACETAVTAPSLADEPVHIAGAFQLAGFRSVVGTLWPVVDPIAARLTGSFYRELTRDGQRRPAVTHVAVALHEAVRELRTHYRDAPAAWAAYVHTGV